MRSRDFAYWLMGYFEIDGDENRPLAAEQVGKIRSHLAMVFKHEIDPSFGDKKAQEELQKIHSGETADVLRKYMESRMGSGGTQSTPFPDGTMLLNC